jgi:LysM repeat protein
MKEASMMTFFKQGSIHHPRFTRRFFVVMLIFLGMSLITTNVNASDTQAILTLVNQARASNGLSPLQVDTCLQNAANAHATDMANSNYFSHTGLNGSSPTSRANAAGYSGGVGENIAAGNGSAQTTFDQWMSSSGHRSNILNASYQTIGIGYAYNASSTYGHYWVQVFGLSTSACSSGTTTTPTTQTTTGTTYTETTNTGTTNTTKQILNPFNTWDGRLNDDIAPAIVYCSNTDFEVWTLDALGTGGIFSFDVSRTQVATTLNQAISSGVNTRIAGNGNQALWALASREIQLQVQQNGGTYDFVFPADACGGLAITATPPASAPDNSSSITVNPNNTTVTTTSLSGQTYTVKAGDNLFRIALNNGIDLNILAAYNNISDPAKIYVGQVIRFP